MDKINLSKWMEMLNQNNRNMVYSYYTYCFEQLPSALKAAFALDAKKEVLDSLVQEIPLGDHDFQPVFKNWITEDTKSASLAGDFVGEYVFRSNSRKMIIHVHVHFKSVNIHFLYDIDDHEAEQWILTVNHKLRLKFGEDKMPGFKVLVEGDGAFYTKDVGTLDFAAVDVNEMYNDDFKEIDETISQAIQKKRSGMILLHGDPGTGKTTYIKHLICKYPEKEFIFIQNDFVNDLLKPSFVSFMLHNKDAILIIEDAERVVISRENRPGDSVVSTILQLTDGMFSDFLNIKIISTFNMHIDKIDKALLRKGRMIAKYKFTALSPEKTKALADKLGHEGVTGALTLADIFGFEQKSFESPVKKSLGFAGD